MGCLLDVVIFLSVDIRRMGDRLREEIVLTIRVQSRVLDMEWVDCEEFEKAI